MPVIRGEAAVGVSIQTLTLVGAALRGDSASHGSSIRAFLACGSSRHGAPSLRSTLAAASRRRATDRMFDWRLERNAYALANGGGDASEQRKRVPFVVRIFESCDRRLRGPNQRRELLLRERMPLTERVQLLRHLICVGGFVDRFTPALNVSEEAVDYRDGIVARDTGRLASCHRAMREGQGEAGTTYVCFCGSVS